MRSPAFPLLLLPLLLALGSTACGRKGDPIPRPRVSPQVCQTRWLSLRELEVRLPLKDAQGESLVGVEQIRVYYLPVGLACPQPAELITRGEVILEQRRPDLPPPGGVIRMDLREIGRPTGWLVVVAVRVGGVIGEPSPVLPWINPGI
nr:hypothetical protein [uncultured Holophaga sp.]